jgi:hypothetical protein
MTMLRGRLTDWRVTPTGVTLTLTDELEVTGARRIGRLLRPGMWPELDSPAMGRPLPWILGALEDVGLVPLRAGSTTRLAAAVAAEDTVIPVVSLDGLPPGGLVQIGAEMVFYTAVDAEAGTLGTATHPVTREAGGTDHKAGRTVLRVPKGGFHWLVADHACRSVAAVRADGMPVAAADWQALTIALGGETAQAVRMTRWPTDADGDQAGQIGATVEGLADEDETLIENPARAIETLLTHARLGGLPAERIDDANLDAIASDLETRGFRFARRLTGEETLGELLDTAAEEAGLWIQATDPIRLVVADPTPHAAAAIDELDETRMLASDAPPGIAARVHAPEGFIPPDAVELVGNAPGVGRARTTRMFPPERRAAGTIPRRFTMRWLDLRWAAAASAIGELLWRRLSEAPFTHEHLYPLGTAAVSCGDTVRLTDGPLGLIEALGWVRAIEAGTAVGGDARARLETWGPWAGAYCWKLDLNHHLRRFAFGGHILVAMAGRSVALLTREGTLRLAGRLRERATLGGAAMNEAIDVNGGWLRFGVGSGGSYTPFLRIDENGDAELTGAARERTTLTIDPGGVCHGADTNRFWLSTDSRNGAMEWREDTQTLHLPGIVVEGVRV